MWVRWERGLARPGGVRSRMVRSSRHSAVTFSAASGRATLSASGCLPKAIGAAWLRHWFLLQNAKRF